MSSQLLPNGKPASCAGCPMQEAQCVTNGIWDSRARITFLGESPEWPSIRPNAPFKGNDGMLLKRIVTSIEKALNMPQGTMHYSVAYVSGSLEKATKETLDKCKNIWMPQWHNTFGNQSGIHVVVPLGMNAAKAVGLTGRKILDIRGKVLQSTIGSHPVTVVPTLSVKHVFAKPGFAQILQHDILRAVKIAYHNEESKQKPISELSKEYRFPRTLDEVRQLCDDIIAYYDPEKQAGPHAWPIAVDTETNTLKPFRKGAKVLMVSLGWDDGKSAAILLDHPENTWYDPAEAWKHVARVLECPKPKVLHNAKFDLQFLEHTYGIHVNNVVWDTMCGQHWLTEDQKGMYGLKALAPQYAPEYEGYEEQLHNALRTGEEVAPSEADVEKEAAELAAASGGANDSAWFEGSYAGEPETPAEEEQEEAPPEDPNLALRADPTFPDTADQKAKDGYIQARDAWFVADAAGDKKGRANAIRKWKKWAKEMNLPEPKPVSTKITKEEDEGFAKVAVETLLPYAAADTDVTRRIVKMQYRKLQMVKRKDDAHAVMDMLYIPATRALGNLEYRGAKVDLDRAREYDTALSLMLEETQRKVWDVACREFNLNAGSQLREVLRDNGFESIKQTKSNLMSTSKDVLATYQSKLVDVLERPDLTADERWAHGRRLELIESLLLFRAAHKMKTSFLKKLREYSALDGKIHTTFHLTGTTTGRLSSSKLNLQNLPAYMCRITRPNPKDRENPTVIHDGFNVKALLIPESEDEVFWNLDIKAAEIRVLCYYSGDQALIDAVAGGLDVHTFFLSKIKHPELSGDALMEKYRHYFKLYKEDDADINKLRTAIKRVVFGTIYGASAQGVARQIGPDCTVEFAQEIIDSLFNAFPGIRKYIDDTKEEARKTGEVRTIFGRYRRFFLAAVSQMHRSKAEREAINFKIQSTSSDLVLAQLCEIDDHLKEIEAVMRLTVHDSMAGTIKRHRVKDLKPFLDHWLVERVKERFPWMPVPFAYDLEVGESYGEKMKYSEWMKTHKEDGTNVAA